MGETITTMESDGSLSVERERLRLGKYTSWAADLSADELLALLWMVGEYGIRSSAASEDPSIGCDVRREVGRRALVSFVHHRPISLEEAKRQIRQGLRPE
jgi:hypothetical protein